MKNSLLKLKKRLLEFYLKTGLDLTRFLYRLKSNVSFPVNLFIELTRNCNGRCIMCSRKKPSFDPTLNMPFSFFKKIADELFPYVKVVDLRGFGESTLLPYWLDIVNYSLKFDCRFGIVTNLSIKNNNMWAHLIKNNFWIGISFDGATKKTFESIRKGNDFETVLSNVKILVLNCKKYKKDINNLYFIVTVQKANLNEIPAIIRLAKRLGIKKVKLSPVRYGKNDDRFLFDKVKIRKVIRQAISLSKKLNIDISFIGSFGVRDLEKSSGHSVKICKRPWESAYITYHGKIGPCNHNLDPPLVFGDLKKDEFKKVWNNSLFDTFRKAISFKHIPSVCKWCFKNRYD